MKQSIKLMLFITAFALTACNKTTPIVEEEGFDYGKVVNNKYSNRFFNIEMDVPAGWNVQDQEQREALMKQGQEAVAGDNAIMKAKLKASEVNSANLLTVYQHEVGAAVDYNANFMLVAENLKNFPSIKSGGQYLDNAKKLIKNSPANISQMDDSYTKKVINGIEFYTMNVTMNVQNIPIHQMYMATVKDGFALGFIYSYMTKEQKTDLENVTNSIKPYRR